ncbi:MAG: hypothetical protein HY985_15380 [Magnetospirillum sp.]|nr:hypothetical protein [Magnetospirillum sp.]
MGSRGPKHLRRTTNTVLDALLQAAAAAYREQPMGYNALHDIVEGLKASSDFDSFYRRAYREMMDIVETEKLEMKRSNAFGRILVHPLGELFDRGTFSRDLLPNIFSFVHLVLGDDAEAYGEQCHAILKDLRDRLDEDFSWDAVYASPEAKRIHWQTLIRIAASFKRWDIRKEWFMKLMQYTPNSVSVASNAFVVKDNHDHEPAEPRIFGEREFCMFFQALFSPLTEMSPADQGLFRQYFGDDPHHRLGPFLVHLAACPV